MQGERSYLRILDNDLEFGPSVVPEADLHRTKKYAVNPQVTWNLLNLKALWHPIWLLSSNPTLNPPAHPGLSSLGQSGVL